MEREDEAEQLPSTTTTPKPTLRDPTPHTGAASSLEMNPVERFQKVNAEKDEGNFLFREKRYAEALQRYHEALAHLKIYRHQWRMSRLRRTLTAHLVPLPPPCTSSSSNLSSSSSSWSSSTSSAAALGAMASRCTTIAAASNSEAIRSGREGSKGKEKMPLDEDYSDEDEQRIATCNDKMELADTRGNEKGKRRNDAEKGAMRESDTEDEQGCKRRRLDKEESADRELEADEMSVDIIDKTSYRLPKDMGCHQSSSTLPSQAIVPSALPSLLPTSWKLLSTPPSVLKQQKSRSFKEMTECEKNLLRLEIIIRLNIAACEIRLGQPDVAILHCRKVLRTNDLECCEPLLFAKALYRKAQCLKLQGRFREACHALQLAATLSPTDRAIRNELTVLEFVLPTLQNYPPKEVFSFLPN